MKKKASIVIISCILFCIIALTATQAYSKNIDYNKSVIELGETVLVNWVNIGDGIYIDRYFDRNGYLFPHRDKKLTKATVAERKCIKKDNGRLFNCSYIVEIEMGGKKYYIRSHEAIPQQDIVLLNW